MIPAVIATCGLMADLPGFDPSFPFAERIGAPSAPLRNAQEAAERARPRRTPHQAGPKLTKWGISSAIFVYHNYGAARNERSGGEPSVRAGTQSLFKIC
jgi:hypothetical protein